MVGICFTTSGTAGVHYLSEKLGFQSSGDRFRVVIRSLPFALDGSSVTGGKLGVGTDGAITTVLLAPSTSLVDSVTVHNTDIARICWNDYGAACSLSITWNPEVVGGAPTVVSG